MRTATFYPTEQPDMPPIKIDSTRDFRREQMLDLLHAIRTKIQQADAVRR